MFKLLVLAVLAVAVQSQSTWSPGVRDSNCPAEDGDFPRFFPGPDCTRYFKCNSGFRCKKTYEFLFIINFKISNEIDEMRCPTGLHFNRNLNVCDIPELAGCTAGGIWQPQPPHWRQFEANEE
jgi:hypothetical protein